MSSMCLIACRHIRHRSLIRFVHYAATKSVRPYSVDASIKKWKYWADVPIKRSVDAATDDSARQEEMIMQGRQQDRIMQDMGSDNIISLLTPYTNTFEAAVVKQSWASSHSLVQLWDSCYAANMDLKWSSLHMFAASFDMSNDINRIRQLAKRMTRTPLRVPLCLPACSLMLHMLTFRKLVDVEFQSYTARLVAAKPSYTIPMLQHRGAIESLLMQHEQLDKAVSYLREHAAGLQIHVVMWTRVMTSLCKQQRQSEAVALYELWMSVLPSTDKLKQLAYYKSIVPNAITYHMLLSSGYSISPQLVMSQLDQLGLLSSFNLHRQIIHTAITKENYTDAIFWWEDMLKRGLSLKELHRHLLNRLLMSYTVTFEAAVVKQSWISSHSLVQLWDSCYAANMDLKWSSLHMFAASFDMSNDINRIRQLAKYMTGTPLRVPLCMSACSLMLHLLESRAIVDVEFQSFISRLVAAKPSYTIPMLQHEGAIDSLLMQPEQVDKAVSYLREHAAGLQMPVSSWTRVMTALWKQRRQSEVVALYELWMSALPATDELEQLAYYESIVPDSLTLRVLERMGAKSLAQKHLARFT